MVVLNVAQLGRFAILNVSGLPSRSDAVGVNEYATPTGAVDGAVPVMVGGLLAGGVVLPALRFTFENAAVASDPSRWLVTASPA